MFFFGSWLSVSVWITWSASSTRICWLVSITRCRYAWVIKQEGQAWISQINRTCTEKDSYWGTVNWCTLSRTCLCWTLTTKNFTPASTNLWPKWMGFWGAKSPGCLLVSKVNTRHPWTLRNRVRVVGGLLMFAQVSVYLWSRKANALPKLQVRPFLLVVLARAYAVSFTWSAWTIYFLKSDAFSSNTCQLYTYKN